MLSKDASSCLHVKMTDNRTETPSNAEVHILIQNQTTCKTHIHTHPMQLERQFLPQSKKCACLVGNRIPDSSSLMAGCEPGHPVTHRPKITIIQLFYNTHTHISTKVVDTSNIVILQVQLFFQKKMLFMQRTMHAIFKVKISTVNNYSCTSVGDQNTQKNNSLDELFNFYAC